MASGHSSTEAGVNSNLEQEGDAAKLKLQNPVINGSKRLKDTPENKMVNLGDSDASAQEKNRCSKNLSEEKKGKEKNLSEKKNRCSKNLSEGDTSKLHFSSNAESFLSAAVKPNASFNGLSLDSNGNLIKFSSIGKVAKNQLEQSSKLRGTFSGLPMNNSLHHSRRENLSIGERNFGFSSNAESFQSAAVNPNASFNGLSLDSNGNLIKFSSIGKVGMNQLEQSSKLRGSFSGEMNDRKKHHNGTSSAFELSHIPPQPPLKWCLPKTRERLPVITSRNVNLCPPVTIVQPAHVQVTNQPSPITRNTVKATTEENHQFSNSRKRSATDFIDLTKPNNLPHLEQQENSSSVRKTSKALKSEKDDTNLS